MKVPNDFIFETAELEQNEELEFVAWCENNDWVVRKIQYVGRRGCPDRLVAGHGQIFLIEMKKSTGRLSKEQKGEIVAFGAAGVKIRVFYSGQAAIDFLKPYTDDLLV